MNKVIELAKSEVGYCEKKSNCDLYEKLSNIGYNNFTKYAYELDKTDLFNGKKNGYAWCSVFVHWLFYKTYGIDNCKKMLYLPNKSSSAGCREFSNLFKKYGKFYNDAQVGDIIFFKSGLTITHTGLVVEVGNNIITTIEGNTSTQNVLVANGGMVAKKIYDKNYSKIYGYGRPNYDIVENVAASINSNNKPVENVEKCVYKLVDFVKDIQKCIGAKVDGIAGKETLSKTITISTLLNRKHKAVKYIQKRLNSLGYNCGSVDGIYGNKTKSAVIRFQKDNGCIADGVMTKGQKTWKKLLNTIV